MNCDKILWKKFKVYDILGNAFLGKYHNPEALTLDENGYLFICASNQNNGVHSKLFRVNGTNLRLTSDKIIAWGKQCPMFSYHNEPCVTSQGMYYYDVSNFSENICLFLVSVLQHSINSKIFGYSNCLIGSKADELTIFLPAKEDGTPDWDYMDQYICEIKKSVSGNFKEWTIQQKKQLKNLLNHDIII